MKTQSSQNIFPVFDEVISRQKKEAFYNQKAISLWFTGLSGSGKTTLAKALERKLLSNGFANHLLDGDNIRAGINQNLSFSPDDRIENIRRIAEVSKLFNDAGLITINCFVSPLTSMRSKASSIIGASNFFEIFVSTPLEECEKRDTKGLYAKARKGEIKDFTGVNAPFEQPTNPFLSIDTTNKSVEECVNTIFEKIKDVIILK